MQTPLSQFQSHQLEVIARVTPHSMAAHMLNTTVMAIAVAGSVPRAQLIVWCVYSYAIASVLLYRHVRSRGQVPRSFPRAARRATVYALLLALPWASMAVLYLGTLPHDEEMILVALVVGMAASGTVLLSAIPAAAISYMSGILLPGAVKCLLLLNQKGYLLLGVLALSYWWFLAALIAKIKREISERSRPMLRSRRVRSGCRTRSRPVRLWHSRGTQDQACHNVAKTLRRSSASSRRRRHMGGAFPRTVHPGGPWLLRRANQGALPEDHRIRPPFALFAQTGGKCGSRRLECGVRHNGGAMLRLKGLTRDITERKRAEERQRLLVRELDHRVKNVLASVATVAQRTREGSGSMDEFLEMFDGRVQSMANAHALLSRSSWQGVNLADLVRSELAPLRGRR